MMCWSRSLRAVQMTSFSVEDQLLLGLSEEAERELAVWAVNTNKLFNESLLLIASCRRSLGWRLSSKQPLLAWVLCSASRLRYTSVYSSFSARMACCELRKILCVLGLSRFSA